jgi:hypothetical protein
MLLHVGVGEASQRPDRHLKTLAAARGDQVGDAAIVRLADRVAVAVERRPCGGLAEGVTSPSVRRLSRGLSRLLGARWLSRGHGAAL